MDEVGRKIWAIAEGYIPGKSIGPAPAMTSYEAMCFLNAGERDAHIQVAIFFEDRDPVGPYTSPFLRGGRIMSASTICGSRKKFRATPPTPV